MHGDFAGVMYEIMAQREEIGALGQRLYNQLLLLSSLAAVVASLASLSVLSLVSGNISVTPEGSSSFLSGAVLYSVLTQVAADPSQLFGSSIFVYGVLQIPS